MIPMRGGSVCACLWLAMAAPAAQPEGPQLARILERMASNFARIPNYTCTQTIDRWRGLEPCPKCQYSDRLRLEVAVVGGKEQFAWPGAGGFGDRNIRELIGRGAILTGDFAGFAKNVFLTDGPIYSYAGETTLGGRRALRYDYRVPVEHSGYRIQANRAETIVGFSGSFWVGTETLDVLRLDLRTSGIPPHMDIQQADSTIEYGRMRIGNSDFLLPQTTETTVLFRDGFRNRNHTRYSACHQYVGESTIRFGESEEASSGAPREPSRGAEPQVPPGLSIDTVLAEPLEFSQCAVGDAVTLVAASPARSGDFRVPKGALLRGRVVRFVEHAQPEPLVVLGLRVFTLEIGDRRMAFHGRLRDARGLAVGPRPRKFPSEVTGADGILFIGPGYSEVPRDLHFHWRTTMGENQ
jgi:hypothetical protein